MNDEQRINPANYASSTKRTRAFMIEAAMTPQQETAVEFVTTTTTGKPIKEGAEYFPSRDF